MKQFALLFAFYLSVLTIAPAFVKVFPCITENKQYDSESCAKKKGCKNSGKDCPFGICCNNCLLFNQEQKDIAFIAPSAKQEEPLPADEQCCSAYAAECWHPPENCSILRQ
jgi:hypothetical protein